MIKTIVVKGYQSLYDVSLELGRFTVIYGESDVGKSALYRAIRGMLTTESGDAFISRGEKGAFVSLTLDTGEKVTWAKRRGQSSEYTLGNEIHRRSKQIPEEISKVLRIAPIVVDGDKFYPNLRGQFDSLFLLFDSSLKRARVLGSLISNILLTGIRQVNLERNRNEADIRAADDLKQTIEEKVNQNWDGLLQEVDTLKKVLVVAERILYRIEEIREIVDEIEHLVPYKSLNYSLLDEKDLTVLATLFGLYDRIQGATEVIKNEKIMLERTDYLMSEADKGKSEAKTQLDDMRDRLTIQCPNCGKDISLVEIGID